MLDIGMVVVAVGIEERVKDRFYHSLTQSTSKAFGLRVIQDGDYLEDGVLNKARALNDGIRGLLGYCAIIVTTDIDMLIPPGLVDYTVFATKPMNNLWAVCRNIDPDRIKQRKWREWLELPTRKSGFGSWNAMLGEDWVRTGGWDERLKGWGGEDDVMKKRRERNGIHTVVCEAFPLMHVNHPRRWQKGDPETVKRVLDGPGKDYLS